MNLIKWDELKNKIEQSKDIEELSQIRDRIKAYEVLAKQSKQSHETQSKITTYRARVDRKMGEWLDENIKQGRPEKRSQAATIKSLGLTKSESSRLQNIAAIPDKQFEKIINQAEIEFKEVSQNMLLNIERGIKKDNRREDAINRKKIDFSKDAGIQIFNQDFRKNEIKDASLDCIITDPPYPKEYLDLWSDLGLFAKKKLKPNGFLIAYCGQRFLNECISRLDKNLNYYWLGMLYHKGPVAQRFEVNMFNRAKPILFYCNGQAKQPEWLDDVLISDSPDKDMHEWGQNIEPFKKLIEAFTKQNELICDPFLGGGTTLKACVEMKRNFIGYEIDTKAFKKVNDLL